MKTLIVGLLIVGLLIIALFFAARWATGRELEKGAQPRFWRGAIIFLAVWLFNGVIMLTGFFNRDQWRLFWGKSVSR